MKKLIFPLITFSFLSLILTVSVLGRSLNDFVASLQGAYEIRNGDAVQTMILQDGYFMNTSYDVSEKKFNYSEGGVYSMKGDSIMMNVEFSTRSKDVVGENRSYRISPANNEIALTSITGKQVWKKVDNGEGGLAGNWRITGRKQGEEISQMPKRARKTLKILSGTRFQWAAINPETKEFFGTGGGTYSFKDGKYTENIEFFSRDSSRVGATLSFEGSVKGNEWHHSGNSSKGDPIYEIWTREL